MNIHPLNQVPALKVGYVLKRFPRLSETFVLNEILELERQGVEVEVFSLMRPPEEERHDLLGDLKAPTFYLPRSKALCNWHLGYAACGAELSQVNPEELCEQWGEREQRLFVGKSKSEAIMLWMQAATLAMLAASRGIQHLHAHFASNATTAALLASRISKIPYSFTAHARDIYHTYVDAPRDDLRRRQVISEARFVTTVSEYNRLHLERIAGEEHALKIRRLYNGIDLMRFRTPSAKLASTRFVAVGRLVEKKGFFHLVEACRRLHQHGHDFHLVIVGEGPEREALQRQIDGAGLQDRVRLLGAMTQNDVIDTMRRATAMILPCVVTASGDRDGLPTSLLEAMAMGLPTISTRVAGIPEIIDQGRTGLLVPAADPKRLAEAMEVMIKNPEQRELMGRNGRRKAEREFDLRKNVSRLRGYFAQSVELANGTDQEHDYAHRVHSSG